MKILEYVVIIFVNYLPLIISELLTEKIENVNIKTVKNISKSENDTFEKYDNNSTQDLTNLHLQNNSLEIAMKSGRFENGTLSSEWNLLPSPTSSNSSAGDLKLENPILLNSNLNISTTSSTSSINNNTTLSNLTSATTSGNINRTESNNENILQEIVSDILEELSEEDLKIQEEWGGNCTAKYWDKCKVVKSWFGYYINKENEEKYYKVICSTQPVVCMRNGWTVNRCHLLCMGECNKEMQAKYDKYVSHEGVCKAHAHGK